MTREEFISVLKEKGYNYRIEGESLIVDYKGDVSLDSLKSLPSGVEFKNEGGVWLDSLTSLPAGVEFKNRGNVSLRSLTSLPAGVEFKNGRHVLLNALTSLPAGVQFRNGGYVWLPSLTSLPAGVQFKNRGNVSLLSLKILPLEDLDYTFQNSGPIYIEGLNMKVEFPESGWVPVKTRRVKTFETFTSDI